MNKRIKKLWLKALRSGEFKQTAGQLRAVRGEAVSHCCLGVLCELHRQDTRRGKWDSETCYIPREGRSSSSVVPPAVAEWAELDDGDPMLARTCASKLNDSGKSFEYIADRIDKYL